MYLHNFHFDFIHYLYKSILHFDIIFLLTEKFIIYILCGNTGNKY